MSTPSSAAAAYKRNLFENAPPLQLVRMLYEGALRFLEQADTAHTSGDGARFQERCVRVQGIVAELRLALDPTQAPELVERLEALYLFVEERLRQAMLAESSSGLDAARDVLTKLLDGWKGVEVPR